MNLKTRIFFFKIKAVKLKRKLKRITGFYSFHF